jgi:hypothetical protein
MNLMSELEEVLQAFLDRRVTLDDLHGWLADRVQAVADANDATLGELVNRLWLLVIEFDEGHRSEELVREEIAALIPTRSVPWQLGAEPIPVRGTSDSVTQHGGVFTLPRPSWSAHISREAVPA